LWRQREREREREREKRRNRVISILTYPSARGRDTERPRESINADAIAVTYYRFYHTFCA